MRDEPDYNSAESRMWCPECDRYVLAKRKRQFSEFNVGMEVFCGIALIVIVYYFFDVAGLVLAVIGAGAGAVMRVVIAMARRPEYLCSRCGMKTAPSDPDEPDDYDEDDDDEPAPQRRRRRRR